MPQSHPRQATSTTPDPTADTRSSPSRPEPGPGIDPDPSTARFSHPVPASPPRPSIAVPRAPDVWSRTVEAEFKVPNLVFEPLRFPRIGAPSNEQIECLLSLITTIEPYLMMMKMMMLWAIFNFFSIPLIHIQK